MSLWASKLGFALRSIRASLAVCSRSSVAYIARSRSMPASDSRTVVGAYYGPVLATEFPERRRHSGVARAEAGGTPMGRMTCMPPLVNTKAMSVAPVKSSAMTPKIAAGIVLTLLGLFMDKFHAVTKGHASEIPSFVKFGQSRKDINTQLPINIQHIDEHPVFTDEAVFETPEV